MGLYAAPPTYASRVGDLEYFARDVRTGEETPVEVETAGPAGAPPAAEVIANLRAQIANLKGRLGLLPGQAGKLSESRRDELLGYYPGGRSAPPRAGAMTEDRKREILAAHPSGRAVLADMGDR